MKSVAIAKRIQEASGKKLVDFVAHLEADQEIAGLKAEIKAFAEGFSLPGV